MNEETSDEDIEALAEYAAAMAAMGAGVYLRDVAKQVHPFLRILKSSHPVKTAAAFGGLLVQKSLQSSCLRLEVLVHLCVASGQGHRAPTQQLLLQGYAAVGNACGYLEDPPEDVFVGNIYSKRGNYRVLEGIWESGTFYLQRFVNLADSLPQDERFGSIANAVHSLLKLSDLICERAGLKRNDVGAANRKSGLPSRLAAKSDQLRNIVHFSPNELARLGIDFDWLTPFIFNPTDRKRILDQAISNTDLEERPIAIEGEDLYLLLPTAVSISIRRFFIKTLGLDENRKILVEELGREYSRLFYMSPWLGEIGHPLPFHHVDWGSICVLSSEVDKGFYLCLLFFLDNLANYSEEEFAGVYIASERLQDELRKASKALQEEISSKPGFRGGYTMVVGCGVGRGVSIEKFFDPHANWAWNFLSAPDFITLGKVKGIHPLNLWRIQAMQGVLGKSGVQLQNMNGVLNLYAWAESLGGHLVPHSQLPDDLAFGVTPLHINITQNGILDLRSQVASSNDEHVEKFVDGSWKLVTRENDSYFEEDNTRPTYVHYDFSKTKRILGARITERRCWWYEALGNSEDDKSMTREHMKMLGVWIVRSVEILESRYGEEIGSGPLLWRCVFDTGQVFPSDSEQGTERDLDDAFETHIDTSARTIEVLVGPGFQRAIYNPRNIAEKALVRAFVIGVAKFAGSALQDVNGIVERIVPDPHARNRHVFHTYKFRDFFHDKYGAHPLTISKFDSAALSLGLGWRVRNPKAGGVIKGKQECAEFLNTLVNQLLKELCTTLRSYNRSDLMSKLLSNYETASRTRDWWHRTAAAVLALREDKVSAMKAMNHQEFRLNGVLQPSRILIEMALSESSQDEAISPSDWDISILLAMASEIFHLGGWSDLVHWDLLEPELIVRPLGDVHARHDFMDTVMSGFSTASSEYRYQSSVRNYEKNLTKVEVLENSYELPGTSDFLDAWKKDFGMEVDDCRRFIDLLENRGIKESEPVFTLRYSELISLMGSPEIAEKVVNFFSLTPRASWWELPAEHKFSDIAPWRFRRRLSLLRRPILQLTQDGDPVYLIAPGLVREGFSLTLGNYYEGAYPDVHLGEAMKQYVGFARERDGKEFNDKVSRRMEELGWRVESEVLLTKILNKSLDRNYGDVDVLAWDPNSGRVLVMECKDLQFRKTYGEIAEQLSDFRGEVTSGGKSRDSLRKHLDRLEILRSHAAQLQRYLSMNALSVVESHLVFSHPVPMQFSEGSIKTLAEMHTYEQLSVFQLNKG